MTFYSYYSYLVLFPCHVFFSPYCCQATIRVWSWASTPENCTVTWAADGCRCNITELAQPSQLTSTGTPLCLPSFFPSSLFLFGHSTSSSRFFNFFLSGWWWGPSSTERRPLRLSFISSSGHVPPAWRWEPFCFANMTSHFPRELHWHLLRMEVLMATHQGHSLVCILRHKTEIKCVCVLSVTCSRVDSVSSTPGTGFQ